MSMRSALEFPQEKTMMSRRVPRARAGGHDAAICLSEEICSSGVWPVALISAEGGGGGEFLVAAGVFAGAGSGGVRAFLVLPRV